MKPAIEAATAAPIWTMIGEEGYASLVGGLILPATRTIALASSSMTLSASNVSSTDPATGLVVDGNERATVDFTGTYLGPTTIRNGFVTIKNANTAVTMTGGTFTGVAASIATQSGQLGYKVSR